MSGHELYFYTDPAQPDATQLSVDSLYVLTDPTISDAERAVNAAQLAIETANAIRTTATTSQPAEFLDSLIDQLPTFVKPGVSMIYAAHLTNQLVELSHV